MTKEMKRPTSHISGNSIKPALSKAVEFYTDNNRQAYECIHERDEYIDYLESQLNNARPQQALPVVPEFVAEIIEYAKNNKKSIRWFFTEDAYMFPEAMDWYAGSDKGLVDDIYAERQCSLINAFITGKYQVEKPQLFYIELPNVYGLKNKVSVSKVENGTIVEFSNGKNYALKLTEQEIKSIDERYWQFAVPVEDGE